MSHVSTLHEIHNEIMYDMDRKLGMEREKVVFINDNYGQGITDPQRYTIEFDQFVKEYPSTYKINLRSFLVQYQKLEHLFEITYRPNKANNKVNDFDILFCIKQIINHLKGMLNPENEIPNKKQATNKTTKPQTIEGYFENYRNLVYLIKSIDLKNDIDYEYSEQLLNRAIGELMALTTLQQNKVLTELNELSENIKRFANSYWRPEQFDLKDEFAEVLYRRFLTEHFIIKLPESLDLNTLIDVVLRVKYNSTLLVKLKTKVFPTATKTAKPLTFEGLFKDGDNAQIVRDILERNGYTIGGHWNGLTKEKTELLCAYCVLKPILKPGKVTPQAKIFYKEFKLSDGYISDRMLTKEPINANRDEFSRIFSHLIPKQ